MTFAELFELVEKSEYKMRWTEARFVVKLKKGRLVRFPTLQIRIYYLTPESILIFIKSKRAFHIRKDMGYVKEFLTKRGQPKEIMLSLMRSVKDCLNKFMINDDVELLHPDFKVLRKVFNFEKERMEEEALS